MKIHEPQNLLTQKLIFEEIKPKLNKSDEASSSKEEKLYFEEKIQRLPSPLSSWSLTWRFCFGWAGLIFSKANKHGLSLNMLPRLSAEFRHASYTNKIRFYFNQLSAELKGKGVSGRPSDFLILRLIFKAFKFDFLLTQVFSILQTLSEYSSSFFMYRILSIKDHYKPENHRLMYVFFTILLICFKLCSILLDQNLFFMMVGSIADSWQEKRKRFV